MSNHDQTTQSRNESFGYTAINQEFQRMILLLLTNLSISNQKMFKELSEAYKAWESYYKVFVILEQKQQEAYSKITECKEKGKELENQKHILEKRKADLEKKNKQIKSKQQVIERQERIIKERETRLRLFKASNDYKIIDSTKDNKETIQYQPDNSIKNKQNLLR